MDDISKTAGEFKIIVPTIDQLDAIAECHMKAFPGEFMTLIGARFIKGFYKFYMTEKDGFVFIAVDGRRCGWETGSEEKIHSKMSSFLYFRHHHCGRGQPVCPSPVR
jgi:hypothetical protein